MFKFDVAEADAEQLNRWLGAVNALMRNMDGDRLNVTVDDILTCNVPDDVVEAYKTLNLGLAANGYFFDNDEQGFLAFLMEDFYDKRKAMKKKMIETQKNIELIQEELKERGVNYEK